MLSENGDGKLVCESSKFRTTDDVIDLSVRKAHFESLELAQASLTRDRIEERDFTSLTLAVNPGRLDEAKALIRKFQDEFDAVMETTDPSMPPLTEVYRLCVQFFPLTGKMPEKQRKKRKGKK